MKLNKKLIIVTLILLSLFMIGSASAASDTQTNVNSDLTHKEKVSHNDNVADKSTDTISKKKSINTKEDNDKTSSTNNNNVLKADKKTFNELQQNITAANNNPTTITLKHDYIQNSTSPIEIKKGQKITIQGNGHTLDAQRKSNIFLIHGKLTLKNLTLKNGKAQKTGYTADGGAIYAKENAYINLNNIIFQNNNAPSEDYSGGGAIYAQKADITINNTQFNNNIGYDGGAIYAGLDSNVTISNSKFNNNNATNYGGAIHAASGSIVSINNSNFNNNNATNYGGAIYAGSAVNVTNSEFKNNHAPNGGALNFNNFLDNFVSSCIFVNNKSTGLSSTIYEWNVANLKINNNIFLNTDSKTITLTNPDLVNCDYNWFGNTANNYTNKPEIGTNINNWLFLNATISNPVIILNPEDITFKLYQYNSSDTGNEVSDYDNTKLKPVNLTITTKNGDTQTKIAQLGKHIKYTANNLGEGSITASIESISYTKKVNIISETSFAALYKNITKSIELGQPVRLTHNYTYDNTTDKNLIKGIPINTTIHIIGNGISISGNNQARIFNVTSNGNLTLENLTLKNGKSNYGGAIYAEETPYINLNNIIFQNNIASLEYGDGGAICAEKTYMIINNTQFYNNKGYTGGAINADSDSTVSINNCKFNNNNATNYGGAIHASPHSTVSISNSNFNNNIGYWGGAIDVNMNSNVSISNCKFNNNNATHSGGAIETLSGLNVTNSEFKNNHAQDYGGGAIRIFNNDNNIVSSCVFVNNTAPEGNAICEFTMSSLEINNNIFLNADSKTITLENPDLVNCDYNWFGNTANNYTNKPTIGVNISNWLFLNVTANPDTVKVNDLSNISFKLYLYNGTHIKEYNNKLLYPVKLTINSVKGKVNTNPAQLGDKIKYTVTDAGDGRVTANIENIKYTIKITNKKADTHITVSNPKITLNTDSTERIIAKLNHANAGTLKYTSNDTSVVSVDKYGKITALKKGNAKITISFTGNNNYNAATNQTVLVTVNLKEITTQITILTNPKNLFKGKTSLINTTLIANGKKLANQKINIKITNNKEYTKTFTGTTDNNGKFTIKIKPNFSGPITIITTYNGNKNNKYLYKATSNSLRKNVQKIIYNIKLDTLQKSYNYNTHINIKGQITSNYQPLDIKNIKITINKVKKTVVLNSKGKFKYTSPYTTTGSYKVLLNCSGTLKNTKYFIKYPTKITITKIPNTTTNKAINIQVSESNKFTGTLNIKIGTKKYKITLKKGKGKQKIKINKPGTYTASIKFPGNNKYTKTHTNSNKFTIKYPTKITITKIPNIKQGSTIQLTIKEQNKYTGIINITIGSEKYTIKLKNGLGKKTVTPKLTPGKYNAKIRFNGNKKYNPTKTISNKFQINKKQKTIDNKTQPNKKQKTIDNKTQPNKKPFVKLDTVIVAFKKTFYVEDANKNYNISLKDIKGKIVKNAQVTLKVKGKTYKKNTNNKGVASFKLTNLDQKGEYKSLIKYAGDENYKASNEKIKLTVKIRFKTVSKSSKDKKTVKKIQKALQKKGYYLHSGKHHLKIDGIFNIWTEKEVKKYQKNNKLPITGKVDYTTAHKLGII